MKLALALHMLADPKLRATESARGAAFFRGHLGDSPAAKKP
jgi:hypothetical protein